MVANLRQNNPAVIDLWVDTHQAICRELHAGFASVPAVDGNRQVELQVTTKAIQGWEMVRQGKRPYLIHNGYVVGRYQQIAKKQFGF